MDEPRSLRALRAAFLKLGLSEDEVQRFLVKLGADLATADTDEATIRRICEEYVHTLQATESRFGGESILSLKMAKIIGGGIALGVLGNLIYDLIESGLAQLSSDEPPSVNELAFAEGWILEKKVSADDGGGRPYIVRGLRKARRDFHLTVTQAARACSVDRNTYLGAERGNLVSEDAAERIKAGIGILIAMHRQQ